MALITDSQLSMVMGQPPHEAGLFIYWHPEKDSVAAVVLVPGATVRGAFEEVVLVCISDGLQFGVLVPSVVKAEASTV